MLVICNAKACKHNQNDVCNSTSVEIEDIEENQIDDFYKLIGSNVKKLRNKKGLSQLQLSQALGHKSVGLVSQSELYLKKQHFNIKHLYQIAFILECEVSDFLKKQED